MGWNTGYTIFEETVVGAYNLGKLDKALLKVLMEPYRGTDIDMGGSHDLESKDGLNVMEIVIKTWGLKVPVEPKMPKEWSKRTAEQDVEWEAYSGKLYSQFRKVTEKFGW